MAQQQNQAEPEVVNENGLELPGVTRQLTPLQYHYLSLLQRLISVKNSYQIDPNFEQWQMKAINKAIYAALRDCIEENIGDAAKEMLRREHQVN